jgi:hypothetical protein
MKKGKKLQKLNPGQRHKLRIALKKLRYTTEFFESLFKGSTAAKHRLEFVGHLKDLQDGLGALNDIAVHQQMATRLAGHKKKPAPAFAAGVVSGREQSEIEPLLRARIQPLASLLMRDAFGANSQSRLSERKWSLRWPWRLSRPPVRDQQHSCVAVGTRVSPRAPRTDPDVQLSRIRLPPRVCDGKAIARPGMKDARFWEPVVRQLRHLARGPGLKKSFTSRG